MKVHRNTHKQRGNPDAQGLCVKSSCEYKEENIERTTATRDSSSLSVYRSPFRVILITM